MSEAAPAVSVVAATRNRAERLEGLLRSLREQTLPAGSFEVVVVDDASTDRTPAVLERERLLGALHLRVITRSRRGGPATARNQGWRAARAPLVAFTDDDCVAAPEWLAAGQAAASDPGTFVQGRTDPVARELPRLGPFARTLQIHELGPHYETCNMFYPQAMLEALGGFEESFPDPGGEDADLAWRAIGAGFEAVFAEDARVYHAVNELGPLGKLRVAARWTGAMQAYARHPQLRSASLTYGVFWKGSHYLLVRALLGLLLRRRAPLVAGWLGRPYLLHLGDRGRVEGGGPLLAPYYLLHDLVELAAVLRGAVRYRVPIL